MKAQSFFLKQDTSFVKCAYQMAFEFLPFLG